MANVNTTSVVPGVLPGLEGLVAPLFQGTMDAYNLPFASYSGQLVAPFTTDQRSAFDRIAGNAVNPVYQSAFNTGIGMATGAGTPSAAYNSAIAGLGFPVNYQSVTAPTVTAGTVNPGNIGTGQFGAQALGQYMSPYLQSVVDTTTSELDRQAGKNQAALRAQLAAKGSFGDRSTLALTEQQRNADQVRANTVAQLMQGGYGQAASLFNTDQARALEAAKANQSAGLQGGIANLNADLTANLNNAGNSLGAQRANQSTDLTAQQLYRQGLGQVAGFDVSNRGLGTQAAQVLGALGSGAQNTNLAGLQALLGSGSLQQQQQQAQDTAAYNQFLRQVGYPQQQVDNLSRILYGAPRGETKTTPAPSDLQTAAGLGTSLLGILGGTGGFGSNGWLTSLFKADGGRVGYANGGEIDDEDDDEVSAFGPLDDDEDEAAGDDGDPQAGAGSVAAGLNAFGEPSGDGGGDDIVGGTGADPVAAPGGSMTDRVRLSGYTREDLQKAAANALPQAIGAQSFFAGGIDNPLTALGLGILASKSSHLGEALGQGGLAALTRISAQKKEAMAAEQLRQKAALAQLQMIDKSVAGDRQALNKALEIEEQEKGKDARTKLEQQIKFAIGERTNASRERVGAGNNAATMGAAATHAAATRDAATTRASAPTQLMRDLAAAGIDPNSPEGKRIIAEHYNKPTGPTTLMRDLEAAGIDPKSPQGQELIARHYGKPVAEVNVDTAQKPLYGELGKFFGEDVGKSREIAGDAAKTLQSADTAEELLNKGIISGTGANFRLGLSRALAGAGLIKGDKVEYTEAFMAEMGRQTLTLVKQLGSGSGISNADRDYAEKVAGGNIELSEAGLRRILEINKRAAKTAIEQHNKKVAPLLNDKNVPDYIKSAMQVAMPELKPAAKASAGSAAAPQIQEGDTATNKATGQRMIYLDGAWTPLLQ